MDKQMNRQQDLGNKIDYLMEQFHVSEQEITEAIQIVGNEFTALEQHFRCKDINQTKLSQGQSLADLNPSL